jgi:hypothetical protein
MVRNQRDETTIISGTDLVIDDTPAMITANGTNNVTISNVAPAGVGTATIAKWLTIRLGETDYYIPLWT